mmetsp:Transcript_105114/g.250244  ORF Transcript_105114/g.250244 Transcript_105114/m.250244 type:complete len:99 (+) Transcript_105114:1325-1621(+)
MRHAADGAKAESGALRHLSHLHQQCGEATSRPLSAWQLVRSGSATIQLLFSLSDGATGGNRRRALARRCQALRGVSGSGEEAWQPVVAAHAALSRMDC